MKLKNAIKGLKTKLLCAFLLTSVLGFSQVATQTFQSKNKRSFNATVSQQQYNAKMTVVSIEDPKHPHYNYTIPENSPNQGSCFTDQLMDAYLRATHQRKAFDKSYKKMVQNVQDKAKDGGPLEAPTQHYVIPVIFHVVYNTSAQNVSTATINAIFDQLNKDYQLQNTDRTNARSQYGFTPAKVDVSFCLAVRDPNNNPLTTPGIDRFQTSVTYFDPNNNANDMKYASSGGVNAWDRSKYLNVWICNISNGANSGVAGYAYSPTTSALPPAAIDGIVLDYHLGVYAGSRALTHEVGHYLGLSHTWGNSNQATSCSTDDGIADTPVTKGPSFNYSGSCSGFQETCPGTQTQYENYMDYSNCTCMFTQDQVDVMQQILATSRKSLQNSNVCDPLNNNPPTADFKANITTVNAGGMVNFTDLSTNYPSSWSWTITPTTGWTYVGGSTAQSQNPTVQFNQVGTYTVKLTASNVNGSDSKTKTDYITVVAGSGGVSPCGDTLNNYTSAELSNATAFGLQGEVGYYPGHITLGNMAVNVSKVAERIAVGSSSLPLSAIEFPVLIAKDEGTANNVTFKIYSDNGGEPGNVLATETKPMSSLNAGYWNRVDFSNPPTVSGHFWVSFEWSTSGAFDTLAFATTSPNDRPAITGSNYSTTSMYVSGSWQHTSDLIGGGSGGVDVSMIVDAIFTSNFNPTISPSTNVSINSGESATLSVSGGASWNWHKGGQSQSFSSSSSVTVSPTTTTTYTVDVTNNDGCTKQLSVTVTVKGGGAGVMNEDGINDNIKVYPNPSNGIFNITAEFGQMQKEVHIQVYNPLGKIIMDKDLNTVQKLKQKINLSNEDSGTYMIRVTGEFGTYTHRVVLMR